MASFISGGGRAYGFEIEIIKSASASSIISNASSFLSESSNSPNAISTRKPRTPRKRPNQTYNEAAALLSIAYPKIFSAKHLTKPSSKFSKLNQKPPFFDPSAAELLLPFPLIDNTFSAILLHNQTIEKPNSRIELKSLNSSSSSSSSCEKFLVESNDFEDDFDTESMLDEEIEEGIDSIMGNLSVENNEIEANTPTSSDIRTNYGRRIDNCYGYPMGLGLGFNGRFDFGFGMRKTERCLRKLDEGDWWRFPSVEAPILKKVPVQKKKKKVEKLINEFPAVDELLPEKSCKALLLKLNYDAVLKEWSDRGSPFPDDTSGSGSGSGPESSRNGLHARLSQIDLLSEEGSGVRAASVLRYKEKRRTRLFSRKIRYQVRKFNADHRPRMKGRFVRRPNSNSNIKSAMSRQ